MTLDRVPTDIVISNLFDICQTVYGRACFAKNDIPQGTTVLSTNCGLGSAILYEFRKEVCARCFRYEYGKYAKVKLSAPDNYHKKKFQGAGLWFCSEKCMESWKQDDLEGLLATAYEDLLLNFQMKFKDVSEEEDERANQVPIASEVISSNWKAVDEWDSKLQRMKKSKQRNLLPALNEEEYASARFVTLTLFNFYKNHPSSRLFDSLQTNELEKITRFPVLLKSQTSVFKFLRITLPEPLQSVLTTERIRLIFGREYGNSFAIRQVTEEGSNENKEFLGYLMSPEASFFNHSCRPNLLKVRVLDHIEFKTIKSIKNGEQLCIDYYQLLDEPYSERQKSLKENWFFGCKCDRCLEEELTQEK